MRHPSIRGFGIRYLVAMSLPLTGLALVLYTIVQLVTVHVAGSVPPPRQFIQASLETISLPEGTNPESPTQK